MSSEAGDGFVLWVTALLMTGLGLLAGYALWHPAPSERQHIICTDYLQGKWHQDVCIKDGKVVSTKP